MATTVHEPPQTGLRRERDSGNGGWRNLVPADGDPRAVRDYSPPPASTGIWVVVYAITMTFAALTSALIVRKGSSLDWQSFTLPSVLYLNTALILCSSVTLEIARRRVATFMGGITIPGESPARWLYITLVFGLLFVTGQYVAWSRLRAEGLYLATNPSSSFFYLLTAAHVLHVLGGLAGLLYVIAKLRKSELRRSTLDAASRYWHFVDLLWVYLLLLLWMKL
ncbi:MAG TPA: cytochrome c oxidase subunit 3 [Terriglobales bacterium]|jgi:cytochrome c oxidase subunit 3|nr:cytochrome c oxidase subunit 3 [Terriglobales bacterium]